MCCPFREGCFGVAAVGGHRVGKVVTIGRGQLTGTANGQPTGLHFSGRVSSHQCRDIVVESRSVGHQMQTERVFRESFLRTFWGTANQHSDTAAQRHSGTAAQRPNTDNSADTSTDSTDLPHARLERRLATGPERLK